MYESGIWERNERRIRKMIKNEKRKTENVIVIGGIDANLHH